MFARLLIAVAVFYPLALSGHAAQSDGLPFFPIGSYELPGDDHVLRQMREAGFNLFVCHNRQQLDRVAAAGARAWVPLPMQLGRDERLRRRVDELKDHPALELWEAPDELVWNLTQKEDLLRGAIYSKTVPDWWITNPGAMDEAYRKADPEIAKFREGAAFVRELDGNRHPIWLNEAGGSDMKLIRSYLASVDITGCDDYPIHGNARTPARVADYTDRYVSIGRGKPVWMVLQGFAWREIMPNRKEEVAYPSFAETRLMAYSALAHGARGILYWGMNVQVGDGPATVLPNDFRESLYAMTSELSALLPFLRQPALKSSAVKLTESDGRSRVDDRGVSLACRRAGPDWVVILANEDNRPHFGVEVTGLQEIEGRKLELLYGSEVVEVAGGAAITRLLPQEVKVFATGRRWESSHRAGRDYRGRGQS